MFLILSPSSILVATPISALLSAIYSSNNRIWTCDSSHLEQMHPALLLYLINSQLSSEDKEIQEKDMHYEHNLRP